MVSSVGESSSSYANGEQRTIYVSAGTRSVRIQFFVQHQYSYGDGWPVYALTINTLNEYKSQRAYTVYLQGPFPPTIPITVGAGGGGGGGGAGMTLNPALCGVSGPLPNYNGTAGNLTQAGNGGSSNPGAIAGGAGGGGGGASGHTITSGGSAGSKGTSSWPGAPLAAPVRKTGTISAAAGSTGTSNTISRGGSGGQGDWAWSNTTCPVGTGTNPLGVSYNGGPASGGVGGAGGFSGVVIIEY